LWPTGPVFAERTKRDLFEEAKARLLDPERSIKRRWCKRWGIHWTDPRFLSLSLVDLIEEEFEDGLEGFMEEREGMDLKALRYEDMFPDEDERNLSTIITHLQEQHPGQDFELIYEQAMSLLAERNQPDE